MTGRPVTPAAPSPADDGPETPIGSAGASRESPAGNIDLHGEGLRTPRREATRQRVLDAALEVFAERGVIGGTVEDICDRAGFTRGAFYSNFADKDDVIDALVEREQNRLLDGVDAMFADIEGEIAAATDLASALQAIIGRILRAVPIDRELSLIQAELENFAIRRPDLAGRFIASNERFRQRITAFISDAMQRHGRELLVEPSILTDALIGITQRSVRRALIDGGDADPNELAAAVLPGLLLAFSRRSTGAAGA
jgi:AcrR family transcriptional regulator